MTGDDIDRLLRRLDHPGRRAGHDLTVLCADAAQVVRDLRAALADAVDAFEECTGDYAQELAADDLARWRRLASGAVTS